MKILCNFFSVSNCKHRGFHKNEGKQKHVFELYLIVTDNDVILSKCLHLDFFRWEVLKMKYKDDI